MEVSQVTTVVSIVGGVVGLATLSVAWSQMRIASAKTKLDLYNKRFNVYLAALELYQTAYSDSKEGLKEKADKFTHAYRESKFLFNTKDGVYETLGKIQKKVGIVKAYDEHRRDDYAFKHNENTARLAERYGETLINMEKDIYALEDQLKKYLSFHNVRGWTIF